MNTNSNFELVGEFHKQFGHPAPDELVNNSVFVENKNLVDLRFSLIKEEINELCLAINQNNLTEIIDALTDILYVSYGTGISFGFNLDVYFKNYMRNLFEDEKLSSFFDKNNTNYQLVQKFVDNNLIRVVNLNLTNFESDKTTKYMYSQLENTLNDLKTSINDKNLDSFYLNLTKIIYLSYLIGSYLGCNLDNAFLIVHKNNMSKLCRDEQEAIDSVAYYKTQMLFENKPISYRVSSDGRFYVVYNTETGKILKSKNWCEPDFKPLFLINNLIFVQGHKVI